MEELPEDEMFVLLYQELRRIARALLARERRSHSLAPTELVNMAFLQLRQSQPLSSLSKEHFLRLASKVMRRLLVDHARAYKAQKRSGSRERVEFAENLVTSEPMADLILAVNKALVRLAELNPVRSEVVQLRYFSGHTFEEIGEILEMADRSAKRHWGLARPQLRGLIDGRLELGES